jgi:hypothetical protein
MAYSVVRFTEGDDAGMFSEVDSTWLSTSAGKTMVEWRDGRAANWKSYPAIIISKGQRY